MYFFRSIFCILFLLITGFTFYQYLSSRKGNAISKKHIIYYDLFFLQIFLFFFQSNLIFLIFLDYPIFLGYLLKQRKFSLFLSGLNILYCSFFLQVPWFYHAIYLLYFLLSTFPSSQHMLIKLVSCKSFFTIFFAFSSMQHPWINQIFLFILILFLFTLLLEKNDNAIKEYEERKNDDTILFQIAHEVKNPIAVCKGYLDMMDLTKIEKVKKYLPIIRSEMNRALTIMDDFLNLKRLTIQKDIMDFYLLMEDVELTMQSILASKRVSLEVPKIEEELLLEGDYERLKQVLINLIKNAYEANANKIQIEVLPKNEKLEVSIMDNGDGIGEKELKKIGQTFYTTKIKGTGIGVSISKKIIQLHQGEIKYDSIVGKGTKVTFTLPSKFLL